MIPTFEYLPNLGTINILMLSWFALGVLGPVNIKTGVG